MYIQNLLCKRYKKTKEEMIDIQKASFELQLPANAIRTLLKKQELKSLKIKDIAKFITKEQQ